MVENGLPKLKQLTLKNVNRKDPYARVLIRRKQADIDDLSKICLVTHRFRSTTETYDINVEA